MKEVTRHYKSVLVLTIILWIVSLYVRPVSAETLTGSIPCNPESDATGAAKAVKRECLAPYSLNLLPILPDGICLDGQCLKFEQINLARKILDKLNMPQGTEIIIPKEWVKK